MIDVVAALSALAQEDRLAAFRLLVKQGPSGLPSGSIADLLAIAPGRMSFHLATLERAGLITSWRAGRKIFYAARYQTMRDLLTFLVEDCCDGQPEICGDLTRLAATCGTGADGTTRTEAFNILFLCTGNSARSIMAEAIVNREGGERFRGYSAGSYPKGEVHPFTLDLLRSLGFPTDDLRSKSWDEFAGPGAVEFDFIFTVCDDAAEESCPVWPGHPMSAHWGVPDPAAATGTEAERRLAFAEACRMLGNRIRAFTSLPFESLGRAALQTRMNAIGQRRDTAAEAAR